MPWFGIAIRPQRQAAVVHLAVVGAVQHRHMGEMEMIAAGGLCERVVRDDCGSIHDLAGSECESSHSTSLNRVMGGTARALELTRPHRTCCTRLALPLTWTTAASRRPSQVGRRPQLADGQPWTCIHRRLETCPQCWEEASRHTLGMDQLFISQHRPLIHSALSFSGASTATTGAAVSTALAWIGHVSAHRCSSIRIDYCLASRLSSIGSRGSSPVMSKARQIHKWSHAARPCRI